LGIWAPPPDEERPTELIIRTYTREEEAEIRRMVEERAAGAWDEAPSSQTAAGAPQAETEPQAPAVIAPRFILRETIPSDPATFEQWLASLAHLHGRVYLRQIAEGLGGKRGGDKVASIAEILRIAGGDPARLLAPKPAA
jgi:hypothetical protein